MVRRPIRNKYSFNMQVSARTMGRKSASSIGFLARSLNELGTRYFKIAAERRSRIGSLRYLFHEAVTPRHFA